MGPRYILNTYSKFVFDSSISEQSPNCLWNVGFSLAPLGVRGESREELATSREVRSINAATKKQFITHDLHS